MNTQLQNHQIIITKASGETQQFSIHKLERSLRNAGADETTRETIVQDIEQWVHHGVTSKMIYKRAFSLLRKHEPKSSVRYRLKQAILELGPSGYPFEQLMGQLFRAYGFQAEVGKVLQGWSITHEMDVIATKQNEQHLVECKYHKEQGKSVSIQVPLYVKSRVEDIVTERSLQKEYKGFTFTPWVITNTKFSSDSIKFSEKNQIKLLAWDYPQNRGMKMLLEKYKLFPITILRSINVDEKKMLLKAGCVSIKQFHKEEKWKEMLNISHRKSSIIDKEINFLMHAQL